MTLRKYGVAATFEVSVIKRAVVDYAVGADWTPVAGDVKVIKDGGAAANIGTLPAAIVSGNGAVWQYVLTATEMQAARVLIVTVDAATKAIEDQMIVVETYGNASAQHEFDLDTPLPSVATAAALAALDARVPAALVSGRMDSSVGAMAAGTVTAAAIATDAIDDDAIATGAISSTAFAAGAITNSAIATDAISSAKIATDAITATKIATDAIGSAELAATAVTEITTGLATSAEIAALAATLAALSTGVGDVPTNAELATALDPLATAVEVTAAVAGLATSAAIATLQTTADAIPTNAELATALSALATAAAIAALQTTADAIPTNAELATALGAVPAAVGALAGVEPTAPPGPTGSLNARLSWTMAQVRNRLVQDQVSALVGTQTLYADDDTTPIGEQTVTVVAGTSVTRTKAVAVP